MQQSVRYVAIGERDEGGDGKCIYCFTAVRKGFPANYPQVCHECADIYTWHYCNRKPRTGNGAK